MLSRLICLASLVFACTILIAQVEKSELSAFFTDYEIVQLQVKEHLSAKSPSSNTYRIPLTIDGSEVTLVLSERNIYSANYKVRAVGSGGTVERRNHSRPVATTGAVLGDLNSRASITLNDDFFYGSIRTSRGEFYIEPARHFDKRAAGDAFVVYNVQDIIEDMPATCGVTEVRKATKEIHQHAERKSMMSCLEVEWGIANDFAMFQDYGSVSGVENHAIGVANDVQTNYDDEFADELQFFISEIFVPTSNGQDPFPSTNNAGSLLDFFANWANNGFSFNHDIGSLWTSRNISFNGNSSTIGLAYVGVVCTGSRYNLLEDWSNNGNLKRVMVSHEIGHNFDSFHDNSGGFIMSPSVNNTTTWSNASINDIENHYMSRNCLAGCSGGGGSAPSPGFDITYFEQCASPFTGQLADVQFDDDSDFNPTSWDWTFEGGDPAASTQENPVIFYDSPGLYSVTLTVGNSFGSNTEVYTNAVEILEQPDASFVPTVNGADASFENITIGALDYNWSFGDGNFSTAFQPTHTYNAEGTYTVTLIVFNDICEDIYTENVQIVLAPTADFSSTATTGCIDHTVSFDATSSVNAVGFDWLFEGGTPATSTDPSPTVEYTTAGDYDVRLIVTNSSGLTDTLESVDYVSAETVPTVGFTAMNTNLMASFVYTGSGASSVSWEFGDGSTGTGVSTTHTYATPGDYDVTMTATNACGSVMDQQLVDIEIAPNASFDANVSPGAVLCPGYITTYTASGQNNLDTYSWTFEGGTPAVSSAPSVAVQYPVEGSYDVKLVVTNSVGVDSIEIVDYITISPEPIADFQVSANQLTASFTNTSVDGDSYLWSFGDGATSTLFEPTHTYATAGVYTVVLEVTNDCGTDSYAQQVSLQSTPVATFTSDVTQGCVTFDVQYTSSASSNTTSLLWSFPGGTPSMSTSTNPSVEYAFAGTYDATLIAGNAEGSDTVTVSNYITALDLPTAALNASVTDNVITLEDLSIGADNAVLQVDGQPLSSNTYTAPSNGVYEVGVLASNACGIDSASTTVMVSAYPTVSIQGATSLSGCSPVSGSYTALSPNSTDYAWSSTGGTVSMANAASTQVTFTQGGTYLVQVEASNSFGSASATLPVTVDIVPAPSATFSATTNAASVTFIADDQGANSYTWDFGDGTTGVGSTVTHTYSSSGEYDVQLAVDAQCGSATTTESIGIEINTSVVAFDVDIVRGCSPLTVEYTDLSSNMPTSWSWTFPGGNPASSTDQHPVVTYEQAGRYDVSMTVENAFGPSTGVLSDFIEVLDVPEAQGDALTAGFDVTFSSSSINASNTTWLPGDGVVLVGDQVDYTYTEPGEYNVLLIAENECGSDTTSIKVTITATNTEDSTQKLQVMVHPNPTRDLLFVSAKEEVTLSLLDMRGKALDLGIDYRGNQEHVVDVSNLIAGVYILSIELAGQRTYRTIVKL